MEWFAAGDYTIAREILQRGVAAVFVLAFVAVLRQFPALLGSGGLLPVPRYLARLERVTRRSRVLTLFWWRYSDALLRTVGWVGLLLALSLVVGLPQAGPWWVPLVAFLLLYVLYLSIVEVGQTFYAFGWETLLLEAGFIVAFLGSDDVAPPVLVLLAARWLVFRVEFGAGLIKMRGDPAWRDLTALYYHHETQPMPGPLSWHAHHAPRWWHRVEVAGNHVTQLGIVWLLFAPQPVASIAAGVIVLTQAWLVVTGNFAWLNALTMVLAASAISDSSWRWLLPFLPEPADDGVASGANIGFGVVVAAFFVLTVVLSYWPVRNLLSQRQLMNASFNRFRLGNTYGAFGSITRRRREVVVAGTLAAEPTEDDWREYGFRGKPGEVRRRPPQVAPYHLRLDWLMWFLALGGRDEAWFVAFLRRLLEADPATLRLLRHDPFDGVAPRFVRARVYRYRYTTRAERRVSGDTWVRVSAGVLVPPVALGDLPPTP
ncbi:protein of unknown function DUF1222 [Beutenbergia cavernae DSM 12333]|uniref:Lipase maturation factor family protein n=1 Tax=Beutenbergia cavernae (strain ATCC BAA-8 / DSM 12333 / CCUG 43141 / JCM 11478 / NBRC 16432 / NCIMB 13614 / HKI 0122) TaxID=471853 RepID=C5BX37_BEUC1|nr:lipase maturation factor family protein [Beutenbergia cavernae]ACQ78712.1 protein of unknown function DUF1222 [Beutenbergia cavernae DSM 12333]